MLTAGDVGGTKTDIAVYSNESGCTCFWSRNSSIALNTESHKPWSANFSIRRRSRLKWRRTMPQDRRHGGDNGTSYISECGRRCQRLCLV